LTDSLPKEIQCGYYKWIINEKGHILPCAFFPEQFTLGTISDSIEMVFNLHKFEDMINNLKKLAIDMKKNGEKITDICEVLYLVEEEQVTA
jgi:radical SAM protein with 4Fe4S-binding SPASM domain